MAKSMSGVVSELKTKYTGFKDSHEKDMIISAGGALVTSLLAMPKLSGFLNTKLGNPRYTGVVEILIGIGLFIVALHTSDGWAALAIGVGFAFILEGAINLIIPAKASAATSTGAPAISAVVAMVPSL